MTVSLEALRAALADRYAVRRELGSGGMATVYLAEDLKHQRPVALKVLREELAVQTGTERFLREITIAASLSHPNILPVHDSGEAWGLLYYVMPFVEGESLRDRLNRERQLPLADALRITREVAAGLGYAHRRGVIHRDVKPDNILLMGGQAVVTDFGIARAVAAAGGPALTGTGFVLGTPIYMSPEQAAGERTIDARSDVYALACVLYEMLAGDPPFGGSTAQAITARKLSGAVPRLSTVRDSVGPVLEGVIARALARTPADRFPTMEAFVEALDRSTSEPRTATSPRPSRRALQRAAVLGVGLAVLAGAWWSFRGLVDLGGSPRFDRVAVLPLGNQSSDSTQNYLVDGLTEGLIADLARLEGVDVISLASVAAYRRTPKPIAEVAGELGVAAVVEGTVAREDGRVRVELRLTAAGEGGEPWTGSFEAAKDSAAELQREVALALARAIGARPTRRPGGARGPAVNATAHDLYLRGRYHLNQRTPEGLQASLDYFRQALAADPAHALSHAGLAQYYSLLPFYTSTIPADAFARARAAARRAVELDPFLAEGHAALGYLLAYHEWDWAGAERAYLRALALKPSDADIHHALSRLLAARGRLPEAIAAAERAHTLDPLSLVAHANIGVIRYFGRDYAEAERRMRATLELDPEFPVAHWGLGLVYEQLGRLEDALASFEKAMAVAGRGSNTLASVGHLYGIAGRRAQAEAILQELLERTRTRPILGYQVALVAVGLGRHEEALEWLERAYQERSTLLSYIAMDPRLDPLRTSPRFAALLHRLNLAPQE